jgi:hypothetical protein
MNGTKSTISTPVTNSKVINKSKISESKKTKFDKEQNEQTQQKTGDRIDLDRFDKAGPGNNPLDSWQNDKPPKWQDETPDIFPQKPPTEPPSPPKIESESKLDEEEVSSYLGYGTWHFVTIFLIFSLVVVIGYFTYCYRRKVIVVTIIRSCYTVFR